MGDFPRDLLLSQSVRASLGVVCFLFKDIVGHYSFGANEIGEDNQYERDHVAPSYRLFQIKLVDEENERELTYYEDEGVLRGSDKFILFSDVDCPGHEEPVCPGKRYGFAERFDHGHVGEF